MVDIFIHRLRSTGVNNYGPLLINWPDDTIILSAELCGRQSVRFGHSIHTCWLRAAPHSCRVYGAPRCSLYAHRGISPAICTGRRSPHELNSLSFVVSLSIILIIIIFMYNVYPPTLYLSLTRFVSLSHSVTACSPFWYWHNDMHLIQSLLDHHAPSGALFMFTDLLHIQ